MSARETPDWLGDAAVCVALTFDLDADVGVGWRRIEERLAALSEARYGAVRGMPRILETLSRRDLKATFYVPGEIAQMHPGLVKRIADGGHTIGHHGHVHLAPDRATAGEQRDELERGLEAIERCIGLRPTGYRSPGWELTPQSMDLLQEFEFVWDSSCMGDDRPYFERYNGVEILELPVHWSLDDWVYYSFTRDGGGTMSGPDALTDAWRLEFESALLEGRLVTYTMHPEVTGRGYRMLTLERLLDEFTDQAGVWFATHAEIADRVLNALSAAVEPRGDGVAREIDAS